MKLYANMMVYNELPFLSYVSERLLSFCDCIVVMDNGSIDGSREWLEQPHERVIPIFHQQTSPPHYSALRNRALEPIPDGAWVLRWDPDELPSDRMVSDLRDLLEADQDLHSGWKIPDYQIFKSRSTCLPIYFGCLRLRLFKKTPKIVWHGAIHEQPTVLGLHGTLSLASGIATIHLGYLAEDRFRRKALHYAAIRNSGFTNHPERLTDRLGLVPMSLPDQITYQASDDWLRTVQEAK